MTSLQDLDRQRREAEEAIAQARHAWEQAQASYNATTQRIQAERQPLLAARIADLEAELRALETERDHGQAFRCSYCSFSSPLKSGLTNHIRRMHPDHYVRPEPSRDVTCPTCGWMGKQLASHYAQSPTCDPARQRREAAIAAADAAYQRVSVADGATDSSRFVCADCQSDAFAPSLSQPSVCVRCAAHANGVEVGQ